MAQSLEADTEVVTQGGVGRYESWKAAPGCALKIETFTKDAPPNLRHQFLTKAASSDTFPLGPGERVTCIYPPFDAIRIKRAIRAMKRPRILRTLVRLWNVIRGR